jgi:hypothetical protein
MGEPQCRKSLILKAFRGEVVNYLKLSEAEGIELTNSRSIDACVEGEGFKMARSESVVTSNKSETRLRTAVRSLWRKMHSPAPIESN